MAKYIVGLEEKSGYSLSGTVDVLNGRNIHCACFFRVGIDLKIAYVEQKSNGDRVLGIIPVTFRYNSIYPNFGAPESEYTLATTGTYTGIMPGPGVGQIYVWAPLTSSVMTAHNMTLGTDGTWTSNVGYYTGVCRDATVFTGIGGDPVVGIVGREFRRVVRYSDGFDVRSYSIGSPGSSGRDIQGVAALSGKNFVYVDGNSSGLDIGQLHTQYSPDVIDLGHNVDTLLSFPNSLSADASQTGSIVRRLILIANSTGLTVRNLSRTTSSTFADGVTAVKVAAEVPTPVTTDYRIKLLEGKSYEAGTLTNINNDDIQAFGFLDSANVVCVHHSSNTFHVDKCVFDPTAGTLTRTEPSATISVPFSAVRNVIYVDSLQRWCLLGRTGTGGQVAFMTSGPDGLPLVRIGNYNIDTGSSTTDAINTLLKLDVGNTTMYFALRNDGRLQRTYPKASSNWTFDAPIATTDFFNICRGPGTGGVIGAVDGAKYALGTILPDASGNPVYTRGATIYEPASTPPYGAHAMDYANGYLLLRSSGSPFGVYYLPVTTGVAFGFEDEVTAVVSDNTTSYTRTPESSVTLSDELDITAATRRPNLHETVTITDEVTKVKRGLADSTHTVRLAEGLDYYAANERQIATLPMQALGLARNTSGVYVFGAVYIGSNQFQVRRWDYDPTTGALNNQNNFLTFTSSFAYQGVLEGPDAWYFVRLGSSTVNCRRYAKSPSTGLPDGFSTQYNIASGVVFRGVAKVTVDGTDMHFVLTNTGDLRRVYPTSANTNLWVIDPAIGNIPGTEGFCDGPLPNSILATGPGNTDLYIHFIETFSGSPVLRRGYKLADTSTGIDEMILVGFSNGTRKLIFRKHNQNVQCDMDLIRHPPITITETIEGVHVEALTRDYDRTVEVDMEIDEDDLALGTGRLLPDTGTITYDLQRQKDHAPLNITDIVSLPTFALARQRNVYVRLESDRVTSNVESLTGYRSISGALHNNVHAMVVTGADELVTISPNDDRLWRWTYNDATETLGGTPTDLGHIGTDSGGFSPRGLTYHAPSGHFVWVDINRNKFYHGTYNRASNSVDNIAELTASGEPNAMNGLVFVDTNRIAVIDRQNQQIVLYDYEPDNARMNNRLVLLGTMHTAEDFQPLALTYRHGVFFVPDAITQKLWAFDFETGTRISNPRELTDAVGIIAGMDFYGDNKLLMVERDNNRIVAMDYVPVGGGVPEAFGIQITDEVEEEAKRGIHLEETITWTIFFETTKQAVAAITEALSQITEALSFQFQRLRGVPDTVTWTISVDAYKGARFRILRETVIITDAVSRTRRAFRSAASGTRAITEAIRKQVTRGITDTVTITDVVTSVTRGDVSITETITITGEVVRKTVAKITDVLSPLTDAAAAVLGATRSASLTATVTDAVTGIRGFARAATAAFGVASDAVSRMLEAVRGAADTVRITDNVNTGDGVFLEEVLVPMMDGIRKQVTRGITETVTTITDAIRTGVNRFPKEIVHISDSVGTGEVIVLTIIMNTAESVRRRITKILRDVVTITDDIIDRGNASRDVDITTSVTDGVTVDSEGGRVLDERLADLDVTVGRRSVIAKGLASSVSLTDVVSIASGGFVALAELISLSLAIATRSFDFVNVTKIYLNKHVTEVIRLNGGRFGHK